jgi:hypothetical protein
MNDERRPARNAAATTSASDASSGGALTASRRLVLRLCRDAHVRQRLADPRVAAKRECRSCELELPLDAFRPDRRRCMRCEADSAEARRKAAA